MNIKITIKNILLKIGSFLKWFFYIVWFNGFPWFITIIILSYFIWIESFWMIRVVGYIYWISKIFWGIWLCKSLIEKWKNTKNELSSVFFCNLLVWFILFWLVNIFSNYLSNIYLSELYSPSQLELYIKTISFVFLINPIFLIYSSLLRSEWRDILLSKIDIFVTNLQILLVFLLLFFNFWFYSYVISLIFNLIFTVLFILFIFIREKKWVIWFKFDNYKIKEHFRFWIKNTFKRIFHYIWARLDELLILIIFGIEILWFYFVAKKIIRRIIKMFSETHIDLFKPLFSKFTKYEIIYKYVYDNLKYFIIYIGILIWLWILFLSPYIIPLVFWVYFSNVIYWINLPENILIIQLFAAIFTVEFIDYWLKNLSFTLSIWNRYLKVLTTILYFIRVLILIWLFCISEILFLFIYIFFLIFIFILNKFTLKNVIDESLENNLLFIKKRFDSGFILFGLTKVVFFILKILNKKTENIIFIKPDNILIIKFIKLIELLIPKNRNIILFWWLYWRDYWENSKYIYEYMLNNNENNFKLFWVTRSVNTYKKLLHERRPVILAWTLEWLFVLFRANVCVISNSFQDISRKKWLNVFFIPSKLKFVNVWHWVSLKISKSERLKNEINDLQKKEQLYWNKLIKKNIFSSEFTKNAEINWVNKEYEITWFPRNDLFFDNKREKTIKNKWFNILYSPTRSYWDKFVKFFPFEDFDENELILFLKNNNINLFLRPHKMWFKKNINLINLFERLSEKSENIFVLNHELYTNINELLPDFDAMISDYSAIYHDFLLLNKPIIFIPTDFEYFKNTIWFIYDYKKYLPWVDVYNKSDFYKELLNLVNWEDLYLEKRTILKNKIHKFADWNSSKRVYEIIKKIL